MGHRSSVDSLPKEVCRWLEWALTENSFTGYAEPEGLLKERGHSITHFSLQRFGYEMEQQLVRVRAATETTRLLAREAGDDPDDRSAGLIILVQTEITDILMHLQESRENDDLFARAKLLVTAPKNIVTLIRASINLKRYQAKVRERVERAVVAAEKIVRKGGFSVETVQALRREILGVVSWRNYRRIFLTPRVMRPLPFCCPTSDAGWQMPLRLR